MQSSQPPPSLVDVQGLVRPRRMDDGRYATGRWSGFCNAWRKLSIWGPPLKTKWCVRPAQGQVGSHWICALAATSRMSSHRGAGLPTLFGPVTSNNVENRRTPSSWSINGCLRLLVARSFVRVLPVVESEFLANAWVAQVAITRTIILI